MRNEKEATSFPNITDLQTQWQKANKQLKEDLIQYVNDSQSKTVKSTI